MSSNFLSYKNYIDLANTNKDNSFNMDKSKKGKLQEMIANQKEKEYKRHDRNIQIHDHDNLMSEKQSMTPSNKDLSSQNSYTVREEPYDSSRKYRSKSQRSIIPSSHPSNDQINDQTKNDPQDQLYLIRERVLSHVNMLDYLNKEYKGLDEKIMIEKRRVVSNMEDQPGKKNNLSSLVKKMDFVIEGSLINVIEERKKAYKFKEMKMYAST